MTPTKPALATSNSGAATAVTSVNMSKGGVCNNRTDSNKRSSQTRYSILSDPRLSQLFALSSQLEALAQSISEETEASEAAPTLAEVNLEVKVDQPPALPPKPRPPHFVAGSRSNFQLNNNFPSTAATAELVQQREGDMAPPGLPPKQNNGNGNSIVTSPGGCMTSTLSSIKYERLEDEDIQENNVSSNNDLVSSLINAAPPPRYSNISENSRMSMSSQGADSTPSAHSLLSDSLLLMQSGDTLPGEDEADTPSSEGGHDDAGLEGPDGAQEEVSGGVLVKPEKAPVTEAEWQARCVELEMSLQKFRDQAHNIRKLLRDKVRFRFDFYIQGVPPPKKVGIFFVTRAIEMVNTAF